MPRSILSTLSVAACAALVGSTLTGTAHAAPGATDREPTPAARCQALAGTTIPADRNAVTIRFLPL